MDIFLKKIQYSEGITDKNNDKSHLGRPQKKLVTL
jgi:hypothetical protein